MPYSKESIYLPIIDNGMGLSRTSWAISMFDAFMNAAFNDRHIVMHGISYPYPDGACNIATADFLESGCDRMIIIDTDEVFTAKQVELLLSHNLPFVSGIYPKKTLGLKFPLELVEDAQFAPNPLAEGVDPLVEAKRVARGFLNVHRQVFETLKPYVPIYEDSDTGKMQYQFWKGLPGGHSEDFAFCDLWRSIGGKVWIDQRITVRHEGSAVYPIPGTYKEGIAA